MREQEGTTAAVAEEGITTGASKRSRRFRSEGEKRQLMEQWKQSGLSRLEYCRLQGICYGAFLRWTRDAADTGKSKFVEVELARPVQDTTAIDESGGLELVAPNGWRIRLRERLDLSRVQQLVQMLSNPC